MTTVFPKVDRLLGLLLLLSLAAPAKSAATAAGQPLEYMIYQYPDVALVVKVDVPEAEFSMRILGPDDALLAEAGVPGRRLGPVFQYLAPADLPRQLMIEVTPGRPLPRPAIVMQLIQLDVDNPNAGVLAQAYRLFSAGTEAARGSDTNTWVVKTYSLRDAARNFAALGMEEMRLWSDYFAAHLVLHRLGDPLTAIELAKDVRLAATRAGFDRIELAALVLEGDALVVLADSGKSGGSSRYLERAGAVFAQIAGLAEQQGLRVEQGRALYYGGQVLEWAGRPEEALEMYGRAIEVSAGAGDADLLTGLRNASAALQESLGQTGGAIAMLDQLAAELEQGGQDDADMDLAAGLFEKGRLLNATYRYAEAAVELARALELQKAGAWSLPWGPTGLELAWARYSMGDAEGAEELLQESLPRTSAREHAELLARAYGSLARIRLARGEFAASSEARRRQAELTGEGAAEARLLLDMAVDAREQYGPGSTEAGSLLRRSRQSAAAAGDRLTERRAGLQLCVLAAEQGGHSTCPADDIDALYRALRESGLPTVAMEAALARAGLLGDQGMTAAAWREMNQLLEELYWLRLALPGVLGAWYEEHREALVRDYLALSVAAMGQLSRDGTPGTLPLLALERVRMLETTGFARAGQGRLDADSEEKLRGLLARREAAAHAGRTDGAAEASRALAAARQGCPGCGGPDHGLLSEEQLQSLLDGLGRAEAILAYDFSGPRGRALLAKRDGVRVLELSPSADLRDGLAALRTELARDAGAAPQGRLDVLGEQLLAPLRDGLPADLYLLPGGPLRGIPFDALRLRGRYLAEERQVVSLAGLSALAHRRTAMPQDYRDRVFLGGDPRRERDPFSLEVNISPEVRAVTDAFVGPGLHVVQGLALQKDEFGDARFSGAALIHLATLGRLDLALPERSYLTLSGGTGVSHENALSPADIRGFDLDASLVVLSRTVVVGDSGTALGGRMPLVSDFLDAGAAAVLLSLWPVGEADAASFATAFYRNIERQADTRNAYVATRQSIIDGGAATKFGTWAGFQLFIR